MTTGSRHPRTDRPSRAPLQIGTLPTRTPKHKYKYARFRVNYVFFCEKKMLFLYFNLLQDDIVYIIVYIYMTLTFKNNIYARTCHFPRVKNNLRFYCLYK